MIRKKYRIVDTIECIKAMLDTERTSTPWSRWLVIKGYPNTEKYSKPDKPTIYIADPISTGSMSAQQGASEQEHGYSLVMGAWTTTHYGGREENLIISSHLMDLFNDPAQLNAVTFDVTYSDGTAYSDTTLLDQGIDIEGMLGPLKFTSDDKKSLFNEYDLQLVL